MRQLVVVGHVPMIFGPSSGLYQARTSRTSESEEGQQSEPAHSITSNLPPPSTTTTTKDSCVCASFIFSYRSFVSLVGWCCARMIVFCGASVKYN